jgi:hypothetical protein
MRGGLLVLGLLMLVIGALFYFVPSVADEQTRAYARASGIDTSVLSWIGFIVMLIGGLLSVLGLLMPSRRYPRDYTRDYDTVDRDYDSVEDEHEYERGARIVKQRKVVTKAKDSKGRRVTKERVETEYER